MQLTIQGNTDVYSISGDAVEQVRAAGVFNLRFKTLGINALLVPVHVAANDIEVFVQTAFLAKNIKGMFLTIPHQSQVLVPLLQCNEDCRVAGAAAAIAASLALFDPAPGKAQALTGHILAAGKTAGTRWVAAGNGDPAGYDRMSNATPPGLKSTDPLPCDVSRLQAPATGVDILMKNQPTPLGRAARARRLVAQPGFDVQVQQVPDCLDFFGCTEAAQPARQDATFVREHQYPIAPAGEIRRTPHPGPSLTGCSARHEGQRIATH